MTKAVRAVRGNAPVRLNRAQLLVTVAVVLLAGGLVFAATLGTLEAVIACGVAGVIAGLVIVGGYRGGVLILMAAFAVAPVYRGIVPALSEGITPVDLLLVAGFALLTPVLLQNRLRLPLMYLVGAAVVAGLGLVSSLFADSPLASIGLLVNWMLMMVGLPVAIALWGPRGKEITALLWSYVAGQMISVAYGVVDGPLANDRYEGLTRHPNSFGEAGVTAFAITLFLFYRHAGRAWLQTLVVACAGLSMVSVVLSGSRAALVVGAVLILMIPIVERSALLGFLLATSGALALMAFLATAAFSGEGSAIGRLAGNSTTTGADKIRAAGREYGWDRFREHPLIGSGLQGVDVIHDLNLSALVALGVFGFAGYLAVMYTFARPLFGAGEFRRLSYVAWSYLGIAPTVPSLWDRATWLPLALSIVAVVGRSSAHPPSAAEPEVELSPGRA